MPFGGFSKEGLGFLTALASSILRLMCAILFLA